jgi:hypothetical protein
VGDRVALRARSLTDGTFKLQSLRHLGKQARARFVGVVVKVEATRLVLSAGGSLVPVKTAQVVKTAGAGDRTFRPGDKVDVTTQIRDGFLEAIPSGITAIDHTDMLILEGLFVAASGDGLDMAVLGHGVVHVVVPAGRTAPPFKAGQPVVVVVTVAADGGLTFLKGTVAERPTEGAPAPRKP